MSLTLDINSDGLKGMQKYIKQFRSFGARIKGVKLNDIEREPYEFASGSSVPTNSYILQDAFIDQDRDFITMDSDQNAAIVAAFEAAAQKQIDKIKGVQKSGDEKAIQRKVDQAAGKAFHEAMFEYMRQVRKNIDNGRIANNTLSDEWSLIKEMWFGRTYPIGIASEQLAENLDADGRAVRNVRLIKGKS